MTIIELIALRNRTEDAIHLAVSEFQHTSGLVIRDIEISYQTFDAISKHPKVKLLAVTLDVRLP